MISLNSSSANRLLFHYAPLAHCVVAFCLPFSVLQGTRVLFTVKMGSEFSLFSATCSTVSKIDPALIVSICKICEILPSLSPSILYNHILSLSRLWKNYESTYRNLRIAVPPLSPVPPRAYLRTFYVHLFRHVGEMMNIWGVHLSANYGSAV